MGPEVYKLELELAKFCKVKHAITCSNGTDALILALMAKNIGVGDAVFVPSFTFASTAEVPAFLGATPIFVDVLFDTFNIDPNSLKLGISKAKSLGLCPKAVIPVDLFGQPADYDEINIIAEENNLYVFSDAAQSFGSTYNGEKVGNFGLATITSFYPSKPFGGYGDGGAIFTNDDEFASIIRSLRVHGEGIDKYDNVKIGLNCRLNTIQAAILLEKFNIFPNEIIQRQNIAEYYCNGLNNVVQVPAIMKKATSVWALYSIILKDNNCRDKMRSFLAECGVSTVIYYPKPLHLQNAYKNYPKIDSKLKISEELSDRILSLPMYPYLDKEKQNYIIDSIVKYID